MAKRGLGRGLDALLADNSIEETSGSGVAVIKISDIEPNRAQARKRFEEAPLLELSDSIKLHGVIQPINVRRKPNGYYEIISGERRWRAAKIAGLSEIPAIVREVDDLEASEISLIENLQREGLNAAEEARGYLDLIERFGLTQEQAAEKVGKSRAEVANVLRLLTLPENVLSLVEDGSLSYGHARALIPLARELGEERIYKEAKRISELELSVRETEKLVKKILSGDPERAEKRESAVGTQYYNRLEQSISESLGRKAKIIQSANGKGHLSVAFSGSDDLESIIKLLCGKDFFDNEI